MELGKFLDYAWLLPFAFIASFYKNTFLNMDMFSELQVVSVMSAVTLKFSGTLSESDPKDNAVLIIGQPRHLAKITFDDVSCKLQPRVSAEVSILCQKDCFRYANISEKTFYKFHTQNCMTSNA